MDIEATEEATHADVAQLTLTEVRERLRRHAAWKVELWTARWSGWSAGCRTARSGSCSSLAQSIPANRPSDTTTTPSKRLD
jgi:hypothetical protein